MRGETLYLNSVSVQTLTKEASELHLADDQLLSRSAFAVTINYTADSPGATANQPTDAGRLEGPFRWGAGWSLRPRFKDASYAKARPVKDSMRATFIFRSSMIANYRIYIFTNLDIQQFPDGQCYHFIANDSEVDRNIDINLDLSTYQSGEVVYLSVLIIPLVDYPADDYTEELAYRTPPLKLIIM